MLHIFPADYKIPKNSRDAFLGFLSLPHSLTITTITQFLTVILEQLERGFKDTTDMPSAIKTLFGGMSALVFERCDKGPTWTRDPSLFMTQEISLPSRYAPITQIRAVVTRHTAEEDVAPALPDCPDGFELLDFDLYVGKKQSNVHTYLCVSRVRIDEGPITSIVALGAREVNEEEEDEEEQEEGKDGAGRKEEQTDCVNSDHSIIKVPPGYTLLDVDVNQGGSTSAQRGKRIYLAYSRSPEHVPVVDIRFIKGGKRTKPPDGFQKVAENLNGGGAGAPHVYLCLKQEGPVTGIRIQKPQNGDVGTVELESLRGFEQLSHLNLSAIGSGACSYSLCHHICANQHSSYFFHLYSKVQCCKER